MALTPEQFKKRLKTVFIALAVLFIAMPLSGLVMIVTGIDFPLPFVIMPMFVACLFYLVYLKISNATTIISITKPIIKAQAEAVIDVQNEVIDRIDGRKIGRKLGEAIGGIQEGYMGAEQPQTATIRCRSCAHPNNEASKFCSECGTQL